MDFVPSRFFGDLEGGFLRALASMSLVDPRTLRLNSLEKVSLRRMTLPRTSRELDSGDSRIFISFPSFCDYLTLMFLYFEDPTRE